MKELHLKPRLIDSEKALADAREGDLSGSAILKAMAGQQNAFFNDLTTGAGKSHALGSMARIVLKANAFGVTIIAVPIKKLMYNNLVCTLPDFDSIGIILEGRPDERCGNRRNRKWAGYEKTGTTSIGKQEICSQCDHAATCSWPDQMDRLVPGVRIVLLTQAYLEVNPEIIGTILRRVGQRAPLLIMDEINFAQVPFLKTISHNHLKNYLATLAQVLKRPGLTDAEQRQIRHVVGDLQYLIAASSAELCTGRWNFYPLGKLSRRVQEEGLRLFDAEYHHLEYALVSLGQQSPETRRRDPNGDIHYTCLPNLDYGGKLLVCSATASPELLEHRLGIRCQSLFSHLKIRHRDSRFYNLNLGTGFKKHHQSRIPEMAHFSASYAMQQLRQNRRTAFVTKQCFLDETVATLNQWFAQFLVSGLVQAVPMDEWLPFDSDAPATEPSGKILLPVLHYRGAIGFNDLEDLENIICLCGYYMLNKEVHRFINEVLPQEEHVTCTLTVKGRPRRRVASVHPSDNYTRNLVRGILEQEELGVVIQAASRVRPFTKPRTVITCQVGESALMPYDNEFATLRQAREFFQIGTPKHHNTQWGDFLIHMLLRQGLTQPQVAARLGIGERTVNRRRDSFINCSQA